MNTALSLNDCAKRLADTVRGPRFDLFIDLRPGTTRASSPGRMAACYFTTGGHCHGQPLPETAVMLIGFLPKTESGGMLIGYSAS